jgi:hypothetical protein
LGYAYKSKEKLGVHKALLFLGNMFTANNDEGTATNLYQVELDTFTPAWMYITARPKACYVLEILGTNKDVPPRQSLSGQRLNHYLSNHCKSRI